MHFSNNFVRCFGLLAAVLLAHPAALRAQTWQWSQALADNVVIGAVLPDPAGGLLAAGSFSGTVTMGATTLVSAGGTDAFVARLDAAGQWLSAVQAGGAADDGAGHVALTPSGDCLLPPAACRLSYPSRVNG